MSIQDRLSFLEEQVKDITRRLEFLFASLGIVPPGNGGSAFLECFGYLKEPTGFLPTANGVPNPTSQIAFDNPTRTFSIEPTNDQYTIVWQCRKFNKTSQSTIQIPDVEGLHFIYFDSVGQLLSTTIFSANLMTDNIWVSMVYWDATNNQYIHFAEERHQSQMDGMTHYNIHVHRGTVFISGLAITNLLPDESGDLDSHAQFGVAEGVILDEDLRHELDSVGSTVGLPIFYRLGAAGDWRRQFNAGFSVLTTGTGRLAWNEWTGATWQLTEVSNVRFVLYHIFATNDIDYAFFSIMGQEEYMTIGEATAGAATEIDTIIEDSNFFLIEFVPIASIIFQTASFYGNAVKARVRDPI